MNKREDIEKYNRMWCEAIQDLYTIIQYDTCTRNNTTSNVSSVDEILNSF